MTSALISANAADIPTNDSNYVRVYNLRKKKLIDYHKNKGTGVSFDVHESGLPFPGAPWPPEKST